MIAVASVLVVALVSLLITRVATVALTLTGLSREVARFQARSALSGVGFTTSEAESMVTHPVRRRVVLSLMLLGSAGLVTAVATLMLSFAGTDQGQAVTRLAVLIPALAAVYLISLSRWVDARLSRMIARLLVRWTDIDARDYAALLHIGGDYSVFELPIAADGWLAGRTVRELDLRAEGAVLLGVTPRSGVFVGAPRWDYVLRGGDVAIVYGERALTARLSRRPAGPEGDLDHQSAVDGHRRGSGPVAES